MSVWDGGRYELTAERLEPAAEVVVGSLGDLAGRRVLDVGCGTGNAALRAAHAGAIVAGVDSAARLVAVAAERAAADGLAVAFQEGDATALPFEDASFDVAISVFAVIFADAEPAAAELLRVVRPGGRIVLTTWVPGGAAGRINEVVSAALGAPPAPPRWSSNAFVTELFAPHPVSFARHAIAFTAGSPEEYLAEQAEHHPIAVATREPVARAGKTEEVRARMLEILEEANEDPAAFRTTSEYDVVTVVRDG